MDCQYPNLMTCTVSTTVHAKPNLYFSTRASRSISLKVVVLVLVVVVVVVLVLVVIYSKYVENRTYQHITV